MENELDLNSVLNYPISKDGIAKFYGIYINPNNNKDVDETFGNYKFSKDKKNTNILDGPVQYKKAILKI